MNQQQRKAHKLWWVYLCFYVCVLAVVAPGYFAGTGFGVITVISTIFEILALIGLWSFIRNTTGPKPSFRPFWTLLSLIITARLLFTWWVFIPELTPWYSTREQRSTAVAFAISVLQIPLVYVLWVYALVRPLNAQKTIGEQNA